jgi:hypothetical protein
MEEMMKSSRLSLKLLIIFLPILFIFAGSIFVGCNFEIGKKEKGKYEIIHNNIDKLTPVIFSKKDVLFKESAPHLPLKPVVIRSKEPELFILDQSESSIKVYDEGGRFLRSIGARGPAPHELSAPFDFNLVGDHIYISDEFLVKVFGLDGSFREYFQLTMRPFKFAISGDFIYFCQIGFQNYILFYQNLRANESSPHGLLLASEYKEVSDIFKNLGFLTTSSKTRRIYFASVLEDRMLAIDPPGEIIFEATRDLSKITGPKLISRHEGEMLLEEGMNYDLQYYDSSIYLLGVNKEKRNCLFQFDENGKVRRILDHGVPGAFIFTVLNDQTFILVDKDDFKVYKVVF